MAVVQAVQSMTLNEQEKMYNVIQHSPPTTCVIVPSDISHVTKTVIQSKRPLAPAPERNTVVYTNGTDVRCKRKIQFMTYGNASQQPASVARRNARERNRVKQVNNGFAALRQHIPTNVLAAFGTPETSGNGRGGSKKLSKVETLRVAVEYIKSLQRMLEEHEAEVTSKNIINAVVDNRYFPGSPDSQQYSPYPLALPTPPSSESSASPTPSQTSEISISSYPPTTIYIQDGYKNFETKGPDDEELLDAIFSWQQSE
ncbi:hypothetical protein ILUMI_11142 [Ignelater luminosus]|uniref:BHLH domain-containing protein n=1 Tax=Ignelater luminosus TaxID=2038154 RepID=A0A8K0GAS8_IGNLU|nr:hypothetical protein ILUMI_11142 [Ignelater luminosus]